MSFYRKTNRGNSYQACSEFEKRKLQEGYKKLEEYESFYLFGKYNNEGVLLYKECFSKFDVDGVKAQQKPKQPRLNVKF